MRRAGYRHVYRDDVPVSIFRQFLNPHIVCSGCREPLFLVDYLVFLRQRLQIGWKPRWNHVVEEEPQAAS